MNFVFIDYADRTDPRREETVPGKRGGKFVQIREDDTEYLVFSPKEFSAYHANIVERFCQENGLSGSYVGEEKRFEIHDRRWVVVGGGKFEIDDEKRLVRLYDNSMAYGRFDPRGLKEKIAQVKELSGCKVRIE